MKKFLITLICYNLLTMPAFCMISDSFAEENLDKTRPYPKPKVLNITDEFAEKNTNKNSALIGPVDLHEFLPKHTSSDYKNYKKATITDKSNLKQVEIKICTPLTTKSSEIDEGDYIEFETVKSVTINNKTYPVGTIVKARVENISQNKSHGVPADIVISNFTLDNHRLLGEITRTGANRSLWVYPISYIGSGFFGLGSLLLFVRGGHAKIKPIERFTVYINN